MPVTVVLPLPAKARELEAELVMLVMVLTSVVLLFVMVRAAPTVTVPMVSAPVPPKLKSVPAVTGFVVTTVPIAASVPGPAKLLATVSVPTPSEALLPSVSVVFGVLRVTPLEVELP